MSVRKKDKRLLEWLEKQEFNEIHNKDKIDFFNVYCKQIKSRNILIIALLLSIIFIVSTLTLNPEYSLTVVFCLIFLEVTFCFVTIKEDTTIINILRKNKDKIKKVCIDVPNEVINAVCMNTKRNPSKFINKFDDNTEFDNYSQNLNNSKFGGFRSRFLLIKEKSILEKFVKFCETYDASDVVVLNIYYYEHKNKVNIISVEEER